MAVQCKYAKRVPNKPLLICTVLEETQGQWANCGNQRYCPKEMRTVLTESAAKCPVRARYEEAQRCAALPAKEEAAPKKKAARKKKAAE